MKTIEVRDDVHDELQEIADIVNELVTNRQAQLDQLQDQINQNAATLKFQVAVNESLRKQAPSWPPHSLTEYWRDRAATLMAELQKTERQVADLMTRAGLRPRDEIKAKIDQLGHGSGDIAWGKYEALLWVIGARDTL